MIKFMTLNGDVAIELNQIIDIKNPLDDIRWKSMNNIILCKKNDIIYKIQFIINTLTFNTLYDVMVYVSKIDTNDDIDINILYIAKPEPPLHPSIQFDDIDVYKQDDDDIPDIPLSFVKWFELEENIKQFMHKYDSYSRLSQNSDKYRFYYKSDRNTFNKLYDIIIYSVYKYIKYEPKNSKYNRNGIIKPDIVINSYCKNKNVDIIRDPDSIKKYIYEYLLSMEEWNIFIDSWKKFWSIDTEFIDFTDLYSNFDLPIIEF